MSIEHLSKFADELKKAREDSDLTLQMMYQRTRIDMKFLQAIEEGNFGIIDEVYLRAFIKAFAKAVGLDELKTIKKFDLARAGKLDDNVEIDIEKEKAEKISASAKKIMFASENVTGPQYEPKQKTKIDSRIIFAASAIVLISLVAYFIFSSGNSGKIIKESPASSENTAALSTQRFELVIDDTTKNAEFSTTDSLNLKISASLATWIRVISDNNSQYEFTLKPQEAKTIVADSVFNLLVGNAGGVKMNLNGKDLDLTGGPGEIKSLRINSAGIKYLKIEPLVQNGKN